MFRDKLMVLLVMGAVVAACGGDDGSDADPGNESLQDPSSKARVKFKTGIRIANDLSQALELDRDELCTELSVHDCFEVHKIVLGGVEPYKLRVDEPLPSAPVAAPMAVERIALTACGERAQRDFDEPGRAALFADVVETSTPEALAAVANRLYERLLARAATAPETEALVGLYDELGERAARNRTWAQLSCFAVATSTEFLFY